MTIYCFFEITISQAKHEKSNLINIPTKRRDEIKKKALQPKPFVEGKL
jgi:hypothetical protein